MNTPYGKVVLITGASSGIGKAIAEFLMREGFRVYGTSRRRQPEKSIKLPGSTGFIEMIQLDVRCEDSIKKAINYILEKEGRIDILINNAGFGIAGAVEDTTAEEAYKQFDTNFFGVLRMCRNVLPVMRQQKKGLIINIGSVAGIISIPFQSMYSASKFALEAMTEALRIEVKPFGIKVSLVEPGDTKTGFTRNREFVAASKHNSVYKERFLKSVNTMVRSEQNGPEPDKVVKVVAKLIKMKNPPVRVTVGFWYKLVVFLKRILPARLAEYVISKIY